MGESRGWGPLVVALAFGACGPPAVEPAKPAPRTEAPVLPTQEVLPPEPTWNALAELELLVVSDARNGGYDRDAWEHWVDADGDCQDARQDVLIEESHVPVTFEDGKRCRVATGRWRCAYSGKEFTDPAKLQIDHFIPLKEAHRSGGYAWSAEKRERYANDLENADHLIAVLAGENMSKGARAPNEWMPDAPRYHCTYLETWVRLKRGWELTVTNQEYEFLDTGLRRCVRAANGQEPAQ